MSSNTSSLALVASKNQQDEIMTDAVHHHVLPHRQSQGQSSQDQRSANLHQSNQGEDESFWWNRLEILTTVAAQAPRMPTQHPVTLPRLNQGFWILGSARGKVFAHPRAPETGAEVCNERANNNYLDLIRTDPRLIFNDYTSEMTTPGRWSYALPTHAPLARMLYCPTGMLLSAEVLRKFVMNTTRIVERVLARSGPALQKNLADIATAREIWHDFNIHIVWIPNDHPLAATHQINIVDNHDKALKQLMPYPPDYEAVLQALITTMHATPAAPLSALTIAEDPSMDTAMASPTKRSNAKEWKPSRYCKGDDCIRNDEFKEFVLQCQFDGYGKYINRFDNDVTEEYINHICTRNMALKWQQQCRRREINKGATQYGEVEKGGPRYDKPSIDFFKAWWACFGGRYHKDDLFTQYSATFPDQKRDKEAILAQANRVPAKIMNTASRAGTHIATNKDNLWYMRRLPVWHNEFVPILASWEEHEKEKLTSEAPEADRSKQPVSKKRKHEEAMSADEADQDDQVEPTKMVCLKYRRNN